MEVKRSVECRPVVVADEAVSLYRGNIRQRRRLRMIPTAAVRRVGPWLAGLYIAAQIFGVVPLIGCHSAHAAGGAVVLSECEGGTGTHSRDHRHHHPGDADDAAHHHALQDLNGVLGSAPHRSEIALVNITVTSPAPHALVGADPALLDRPPKAFLSI
jgi:hypothetical protein